MAHTARMVMIEKSVLEELKKDQRLLDALQAAGVDNWEGWDAAMDILNETKD